MMKKIVHAFMKYEKVMAIILLGGTEISVVFDIDMG